MAVTSGGCDGLFRRTLVINFAPPGSQGGGRRGCGLADRGRPRGHAATRSLTLIHESSFIPPYDAFFKNKLASAYEKATGIKVELRRGKRRQPADPRHHARPRTAAAPTWRTMGFNWAFLFDEKLVDVSDIAAEVGKAAAAAGTKSAQEAVVVNGKWKAIPYANIGQLMNWRTDWFKQVGLRQVPRHLGRAARGRHQAQEDGPSVRLRTRPRLRRQSRLALSAAVVLWRPRGRGRRQDHRDRFRRDRARGGLLPPSSYKETMLEDVPRLDRRQQQQGLPVASRSPAPTTPSRSCGSPSSDFPEIAKVHRPVAKSARRRKGASICSTPQAHAIFTHTPGQAGGEGRSCAGSCEPKPQLGPWYDIGGSPTISRSCTRYDDAPDVEGRTAQPAVTATRSRPRICRDGRQPLSRAQSEAIAKYVVIDMFAKACAGASTKEVIADAVAQLNADLQARRDGRDHIGNRSRRR